MKALQYPYGWFWRDAKWWQFWMPQSGYPGGAIFGAIVVAIWFAFMAFIK